jgi:hypothetical protein
VTSLAEASVSPSRLRHMLRVDGDHYDVGFVDQRIELAPTGFALTCLDDQCRLEQGGAGNGRSSDRDTHRVAKPILDGLHHEYRLEPRAAWPGSRVRREVLRITRLSAGHEDRALAWARCHGTTNV